MIIRKKETIEIWNVCECGNTLHSIHEGKRGQCSACWVKATPKETKQALNKVISAAFKKNLPTQTKQKLVDDAITELEKLDGK